MFKYTAFPGVQIRRKTSYRLASFKLNIHTLARAYTSYISKPLQLVLIIYCFTSNAPSVNELTTGVQVLDWAYVVVWITHSHTL